MAPSIDVSAYYIPAIRVGPSPWPEASTTAYRLCGTCEQLDFKHLCHDAPRTSRKIILEHGLGGIRGNKETCDLCTVLWHALHDPVKENSDGSYPDRTHVILQCPHLEWSPGTFHWRSAYRSSYVLPGADDPNPAYAIDILVQQTRPNGAAEDPNQLNWDIGDPRDKVGSLKVYLRGSKKGDEITQVISGRPLTAPDSDDAMCTIKDWVEACIEDHTECTVGHASLPPPRLIEILADGSMARLVEAGGVEEPFCALSYCWGRAEPLRTKRANYEAFCQRIPIQDLPLTIQQAMEVTRRVGYRYLWVDSICIIQDDKADWARHTIIMGSIYANAVLTIAATGATGGSEGCYRPRPKAETGEESPYRIEARIPCVWAGRYLGDMFAAPWDDTFSLSFEDPGPRWELNGSEWSTRAWVFQEIYFSRRLVLFGKSQISWTCRVCTARQMSPWSEAWSDSFGAANSLRGPDPGCSVAGSWMKMLLSQYSRTKLTYTSDRLPAIAAIAREWELAHGQSYAAGLLIDPESLLWIPSRPGVELQPPGIPPSDRAATWSWAHWEGYVQPFVGWSDKFSSHIKPSDIRLLRSGDEYSHHQSTLVFSSFVRAATRSADPVDHRHMFPIHNLNPAMCGLTFHAVSGPGHNGLVVLDDPSSAPVDFELLSIGGCLVCDLSIYYGLSLSLAVKRTKKPEDMQAGDLPPNCYQRLGVAFHFRGCFGPFRSSGKLGTLWGKLQRGYWKGTERTGLQPRAILRRHLRWQEVALI
ncbi:hypothetical protein RB595_005331 [Gaeumannomyces hyphopodioides]